MFAYRHSFHAGNHADVLKHAVLCAVLDYMNQKEKPYWMVDTHAGAGYYSLAAKEALRNGEFETGIEALLSSLNGAREVPQLLSRYLAAIAALRELHGPQSYPGSPALSAHFLRESDHFRGFELHPTDFPLLRRFFARSQIAHVDQTDGFAGLKASLPPPTRRAVVLIDPPYELKQDYRFVWDAMTDCVARFAQGVYMVWYPMLARSEPTLLADRLAKLKVKWLSVSLKVCEQGFGMQGSTMFTVNPPYTLKAELEAAMPLLKRALGQDSSARYTIESFDL
jgi:23S rRNA (adenine2030-N6)-methyltransferase